MSTTTFEKKTIDMRPETRQQQQSPAKVARQQGEEEIRWLRTSTVAAAGAHERE